MREVKVSPRKYDAPRRVEQAAATRAVIVDAAERLFTERGYGATTIAAIAREARVAVRSVYDLGDKGQLLTLAVDRAIAGDDEPTPLLDRPRLRSLLAAGDAYDLARLGAAVGAPMLLRLYPLYRAFEQAAAVDADVACRWREYQQRRWQDVRRVVEAVQAVAPLRAGLDIDRATATLWALLSWHPIALLVEEAGWSPEDIQHWIEDVLVALLLDQPDFSNRTSRPI